jgi:large subunit ribosomal protein L10
LPITRQKKEELIAQYKELVKNSSALVFTHYRGIDVKQQRALRAKLSEVGATYVVVKNTLLGLVLKQARNLEADALLSGPNGVVFLSEDMSKGVTALKDWIKDVKLVEITGAIVETSVLDAAAAEKLSDLPTKEQVRAQLLGMLAAPAGKLVRTIAAPGASLARVLNAHAEQQKEAA